MELCCRYFSCVWAKKSNRKHKKWEGDALLRLAATSAVLVDEQGRELGRSSGYKVAELEAVEEGGRLGVGGKEVEVTDASTAAEWERLVGEARREVGAAARAKQEARSAGKQVGASGEWVEEKLVPSPPPVPPPTQPGAQSANPIMFKPFRVPALVSSPLAQYTPSRAVAPGQPMFDPLRQGAVVLPRPPPGHALGVEGRLVDVVLDPFVGRHLRPHQRQGLAFIYERVLGFTAVRVGAEEVPAEGAILADEMGLGKTLQTVALVWTLLKQSPVAGTQLARKVLIVAPSSLLANWQKEFRKWLGSERITIHIAETGDMVAKFRSYSSAPVLLVSYEMMVRTVAQLAEVPWDLVVCDEAHRLKNASIKASTSLARLACRRRLLLTGTPVQNDLGEFHSLVEAAAPGLLGGRQRFAREVEAPVEAARQPGATLEDRERGRRAMDALDATTRQIVLRRTQEVINKYLPPKTVSVVFCRPSQYQAELYCKEVT